MKNKERLYEDVIHPVAKSAGKLIATPVNAINAALADVRIWIEQKEFSIRMEEVLNNKLSEALKDVSPEKIVTPDRGIVLPILRNLYYANDNEYIYNKYASLLATNMNLDTREMTHPAFIQIIEQLSTLDAKAIDSAKYLVDYQPLIRIFSCKEQPLQDKKMTNCGMPEFGNAEKKSPLFSHYSYAIPGVKSTVQERALVIQNLNRLGLINIDYRERIISENDYKALYDELVNSSLYSDFVDLTKQNKEYLQLTDGYTSPTDFGRLFYDVCCKAFV